MNGETLIPRVGVVTEVRIDTPDIKNFRVVGTDGKNRSCISPDNAR